jgi:hypothetical protein
MTDVALARINSFAQGSPNPDSLDEIFLEQHLSNDKIAIFREENDKPRAKLHQILEIVNTEIQTLLLSKIITVS